MKIIAETKDGYLVDMDKNEIATLQGISWVDRRFKSPKPGDKVDISRVYETVASLSYDQDVIEIERYGNQLLKASSWLKNYKEKQKEHTKELKYQEGE
jgi:carboxylesterase type B